MSSDRWMDKEDAKYTYNGTPFSLKKKLTSPVITACMNQEDLLLEWNKPDTERQILHVIYMKNLKCSKSKKQRAELWLPWSMGGWMRRNCRLKKHSQSIHETGSSGLVHWDDLRDGMGREVGGGSGKGTMYTHGWFMSMYGKSHYNIVNSLQLK